MQVSTMGVREGGGDGFGKALEAVHNGDQDVLKSAVFQLVHHREPEFGTFVLGDPQAQNLAFALWGDAQGHVNGLVFDLAAFRIADFDPQGIQKNNRIHRFQSPVLPI